jgi:hypothetical protein
MLNSTVEADDVGDYLRVKYPNAFGATDSGDAQLLVIHTDRSGDVSKKDLDAARSVARQVDEGSSPSMPSSACSCCARAGTYRTSR